ncbi:hypothetical protein MJ3_03307 [Salimicrobium jeotgali]|uniref:Uncharacterized protein n=1 Tax=Salimicrobium jeotgali TaxID=1230341 RepID=K2H9W2_9BACI|nr:hypothetical protein MJ3_03307 [Salimicrobium jeotgali]
MNNSISDPLSAEVCLLADASYFLRVYAIMEVVWYAKVMFDMIMKYVISIEEERLCPELVKIR